MKTNMLRIVCIILLSVFFFNHPITALSGEISDSKSAKTKITGFEAQSDLDLTGKSAIVVNKNNGEILYEKDIHTKRPNGSISKLTTAVVAVEEGNLDDIVTVSSYAAGRGGTTANLQAGEKLTLEEMIYAMIFPSGNDAATAIAEHIGGTEANFVSMMNNKIKEIGVSNTRYSNPRGSDGSTPYDLALIASYALDNEFLAEVLATRRIELTESKSGETRTYSNINIGRIRRMVPGVNGVKWGHTPCSGHCLIASAVRDERYIITVVMDSADYLEDSEKLLEYGFDETYIPVDSVALDKKEVTMSFGESVFLNATIEPSSAMNKNIIWSSDNPSVATVIDDGRVIAIGYGEAVITAKTECGEKTAECVISVPYVEVESVKFEVDYKEMATGETINLTPEIYPEEATDKTVTWSSDNPGVAEVNSDGRVTVLDVGEAVITVITECGGKTAEYTISVPYVEPESVEINVESVKLNLSGVGSRKRLLSEVLPVNTSYKDVMWTSADSSVVFVDNGGIITAEGPGEVVVTVETEDRNLTDTCIVKVNDDNIKYGDVNGDGVINVSDVIVLLRYVVGMGSLEGDQLKAADVNGNGEVNVEDAIKILRYIVRLD